MDEPSGLGGEHLAADDRVFVNEQGGLRNPDRNLVEIVEIPSHPFFVAVQFHPELKSRPNRPHPLFREFVGAALRHRSAAAD